MHTCSSYFSHVAKQLAENDIESLAYDQESHGRSEGTLGNIRDLHEYVNCGIDYIIESKKHYREDLPIFILGQSMGGTVCVNIALKIPNMITGMILFAPALGVNPNLEPFLIKIMKVLACCCPCLPTKAGDLTTYSQNPDNLQWYLDNPEIYTGKLNARSGAAILRAFDKLAHQ